MGLGLVLLLAGGFIFFSTYTARAPSSVLPAATTTNDGVSPTTATPATSAAKVTPPTTTTTLPLRTKDGTPIVYYRNDGFYPKKLEVKLGSSVRFMNIADRPMRIFSTEKVDPTFTILNQSTTVGKGGKYDFTFISRGEWKFYNLSNPQHTGSVVVY